MNIIYADQPLPNEMPPSIFLAGPSPRNNNAESWRPQAIDILRDFGWKGTLLIPEPGRCVPAPRSRTPGCIGHFDYDAQLGWEHRALTEATVIVFWVPRDLQTLPGFTTNGEFGMYVESGKVVYGRPTNSPKCGWLDWHYRRVYGRQPHETLGSVLKSAARKVGEAIVGRAVVDVIQQQNRNDNVREERIF